MDNIDTILQLVGAWGAFGLMGTLLLGFAIFFTLYYSDRRDREPFAMLITILALTLCLTTVALFPVDIYLVSRIMNLTTGLRYEWATDQAIKDMQLWVKIIYYVAYSLIISFCFVWVPLSYFYYEELADEVQTTGQRLWTSFKYTIICIVVAALLMFTGLLMKPNPTANPDHPPDRHGGVDLDWLRKRLSELDATTAIAFVAGVLALAGMGVLVFYTAPGLTLLPLHLLAGPKSLPPVKSSETHARLMVNRERQNAILSKYSGLRRFGGGGGGGVREAHQQALSDRDRQQISELAQEELILENRTRRVQRLRNSWFHKCQWIIRPVQVLMGILAAGLSILLVGSIAATSVGHLTEEVCGASCKYIFRNKDISNPLNLVFLKLSPYFPLDYILIVLIILYLFWATTKGVISIGIRLLWINLYKFRRHATQPQGLLAGTMLLMLSLAGLSYILTMSVAPEYSMFGSQRYCNNTLPVTGTRDCSKTPALIIPCHVGAPPKLCTATVTSLAIVQVILATPSLGIAFFYLQWLFLMMFLFALMYNVFQGCSRGFGVDPLDEDGDGDEDLEDMETRGLLSGGAMRTEDGQRRVRRRGFINAGAVEGQGQGQAQGQRHGQGYGQDQGQGQVRSAPGQQPGYVPGASYGAVRR
ncbi:hypothetical protein EDD11_010588 [Mortierella claussenii]|nr:hypothetical protein EDD11_010588 [Mortierella claussenii]